MQSRARQVDEKALFKELFALAVPIGLQNLLVALTGATDALMLGRLTQDAVAAVSLANQIAFVMSLFTSAAVGGVGALIAQYWGKGDRPMVRNLFCMGQKWTVGISFVFFLLALLIPESLMRFFTPEAELIRIGADYLRVVSFSYLFNGLTQCYFMLMKLEGKAGKSVIISIVSLLTDMVLDLFLIYGTFGAPKLGAAGSAYSTVAVEAVALIWCVVESHRGDSIRPTVEGWKWHSAQADRDFFKIALPMLGSALAWGLSITVHNLIMGHMGTDATAAASITSTVQELITCACRGVASGIGIMIGKLLGQSQFDKAKEYGEISWKVSTWVGALNTALALLFTPIALAFFVLSAEAKQLLLYMLLFDGLYVFAYSYNTVMTCGVFPAGGDARYDAISVFFATWCFAIPLSLLGAFVFHWPVMVVYIMMCADEIVKLPWLYPRYKKYIWLKNLTEAEQR